MRKLYPEIEPFRTGFLKVDEEHTLYWEESGKPNGVPLLFLHGGPGVGTEPMQRRFFDPHHYRIILFDQRGCGKSQPFSSLNRNTTWDLVQDIEKLRHFFEIDQWLVFGGSWGSTLALCYAIKYPKQVKGLILRGIFLCRPKEFHWFYQFGAHCLFPDIWENFIRPIPVEERGHFIQAFYKRVTSPDREIRAEAAKAWAGWEAATVRLELDPSLFANFTEESHADSIARIECHYFINQAFFDSPNWILENIAPIRHLPCTIIHGRYDIPCPVENAWELHQAWPEAKLNIIPAAGHASTEVGVLDALVHATDEFKNIS